MYPAEKWGKMSGKLVLRGAEIEADSGDYGVGKRPRKNLLVAYVRTQ